MTSALRCVGLVSPYSLSRLKNQTAAFRTHRYTSLGLGCTTCVLTRCTRNTSSFNKANSSSASSPAPTSFQSLAAAAELELRKEIEIDEGHGIKSIPPLVPNGWVSYHEPKSRYIILKSVQPPVRRGSTPTPPVTPRNKVLNTMTTKSGKTFAGLPPNKGEDTSSSETHVEIHVPFATMDPSFANNTIDLCEYQPFDVFCFLKSKNKNSSDGQYAHNSTMLISMAAVNSEARIRRIQFLTPAVCAALGASTPPVVAPGQTGLAGDLVGYGLRAEYLRTLAYSGPIISECSSALQNCLSEFIATPVSEGGAGIDGHMLEYILQACYYAEHEEYQWWLMELAGFAAARS
eukprot:Tbor_TRINITY_DN5282_c0_g1::TRINITY_DN5282_c0_g1_i1::g.16550::m.16550